MEARSRYATQKIKVLAWLKSVGNITSLEALKLFGAFRLAAIIHRLRNEGHIIESVPTSKKGYRYVTYIYKGESAAQ